MEEVAAEITKAYKAAKLFQTMAIVEGCKGIFYRGVGEEFGST